MIHWVKRLALAATLVALAAPASAKWHEAQSDHFVVYADDNPKDIQRFAEQLERFHSAMGFITTGVDLKPSPSNRVTVYVVRSDNEVRRLAGKDVSKYVKGFYVRRAGGSFAIIPQVDAAANGEMDNSMIIMLHEYAHHFLISSSVQALPRWLNEGGAEFYASVKFEKDGGVKIGRPANHRAGELFFAKDVKVHDLLDPEQYEKRKNKDSYDAFYGKSWLLYHYLVFEPSRRKQLGTYLTNLSKGMAMKPAAQAAFGDFDVLEKEVDRYLKNRKMLTFKLPPDKLPVGTVSVRPLREGEAAVIPVRIQSRRGVNKESAAQVLIDARAVAAKYPSDPAVLSALAEAEYEVGNDKEAIAAADKAIAVDPKEVNAYVQKGYALFRMAEDADDQETAYKEARKPFVALNKLENDHPLPLVYYYRSHRALGKPPELAVQGLEQAVGLAPFDMGLRLMLARQYMRDNKMVEARAMLLPIAYNPHGGRQAAVAQEIIEKIDQKTATTKDVETEAVPDDAEE